MRKRICAFVGNPPVRGGAFSLVSSEGARFVINDFFYNMMLYGDFDEYHFFCTDPSYAEDVTKSGNIKLFKRKHYNVQIHNEEYEVIYANLCPDVLELCRLRSARDKSFKIFSFIHSQHFIEHFWLSLEYANMCGPDDILLSSSQTGKAVLQSFFSCRSCQNRRLADARIEVVPFGVDVERLNNIDRDSARREVGVPGDAKILLSLNRFSSLDKADLIPVIHIFEGLRSQLKGAVLVMAGADPGLGYLDVLERYIDEHHLSDVVYLFKNISEEFKQQLYSCADVFVSFADSIQETYGLTLNEAQSHGLPVICSDWDGYKELVEEGVNGFRIPTYWDSFEFFVQRSENQHLQKLALQKNSVAIDIEESIEKLSLVLRDNKMRSSISAANIDKILNNFTWESIIQKHLKLISSSHCSKGRVYERTEQKVDENKPDFHYYDHFKRYPTINAFFDNPSLCLETKQQVAIPDFLLRYYQNELIFLSDLLREEILECLLSYFEKSRKLDVESLALDLGCKEAVIRYCILWLLKQGFLAIDTRAKR